MEQIFLKKHEEAIEEVENHTVKTKMVYAKNTVFLNFFAALFTILILGIGGIKVIRGKLTVGGLIAFNMYAQKLVFPLIKVSGVLMTLQSVLISLERLESFFQEPEIVSNPLAIECKFEKQNFLISYQNVCFTYEEKTVLNGVSMEFYPNKLNVVVGESGCGKSTLTLLLYRLWETQSGIIAINGCDHRLYDIKNLRKSVAVVSQEAFLFNDSILNNILMGKALDMEIVYKCARIACIHDFILSLPNQYESMVGDRGVKLSGGEKQRICLVRALVQDTPVIILDEATSALDQLTEKQIMDNLIKQIMNKTIIMITHRLYSITEADIIYVLKDGKIEAQGKHDELIKKSYYYKKLFNRDIK